MGLSHCATCRPFQSSIFLSPHYNTLLLQVKAIPGTLTSSCLRFCCRAAFSRSVVASCSLTMAACCLSCCRAALSCLAASHSNCGEVHGQLPLEKQAQCSLLQHVKSDVRGCMYACIHHLLCAHFERGSHVLSYLVATRLPQAAQRRHIVG